MNVLLTQIHRAVVLALLTLAAPAAFAQAPHGGMSPQGGLEGSPEIAHKSSVSRRFAYVAAPPGTARDAVATQRHFAQGYDPGDQPLAPDTRYWDFFTVDLEVLGKRTTPDAHDPELMHVQGTIPGDAIVGVSHFYLNESRHLWIEMDHQTNRNYLSRLPRGAYPRVRYQGDLHAGKHFTAEVGVTGPKLILNQDMRALEALSTNPDEITVVVHAAPTLMSYSDRAGNQTMLQPRALAQMIHAEIARQGLAPNITVRLLGCEAGRNAPGTYGAAQQLADALVTPEHPEGNPVIAASGVTFMNFHPTSSGDGPELVALPPSISPARDRAEVPRWQVYRSANAALARQPAARGAHATVDADEPPANDNADGTRMRLNARRTVRPRVRSVSARARAMGAMRPANRAPQLRPRIGR